MSKARDRLDVSIWRAFNQHNPTLVEALPAMGKSRGVVKWAKVTGNSLSIFTSRHELYGQYEEWCAEYGLTYLSLPTFHNECETIGSEQPIEAEVYEAYKSGISGAEIHRNSQRYFGQQLPCQHHSCCPYMEKREFEADNYDVLIGHYLQAHNQEYLANRYVVIDEFPANAYLFEPTHNEATNAITNYLKDSSALPFNNWKDLIRNRHKSEYEDAIEKWVADLGFYSHRDTRLRLQQNPGFHAYAPLLTYAGLKFELLKNEWEYATLGFGRITVRNPEDEWTILMPPNFSASESVVALDGTPSSTKWELILGEDSVNHETVLESDEKKREYLRDVLGLKIVQTNAGAKPYLSGNHVSIDSDGALLEEIRAREETRATVITSKKAEEDYESSEVDRLTARVEHYGDLKGINNLGKISVGAVIGSPHPPEDESVKRWAAFTGESVQREGGPDARGDDLDFGALGNALFQDVVNDEVLQAVMRFTRKESENKHETVVYVHTSRLPAWVNPDEFLSIRTWSDGMREIFSALSCSKCWPDGELTNKEIAADLSISKRQVGNLMQLLETDGYVTSRRGGQGNAYHWSNKRLEEITIFGRIE